MCWPASPMRCCRSDGGAKDFAAALQDAFRGQNGGALAGLVRVVPMERINAVLVVSPPAALHRRGASRLRAGRGRGAQTMRSWHVYYLQNSHAQRRRLRAAAGIHAEQRDGAADGATQPAPRPASGGHARRRRWPGRRGRRRLGAAAGSAAASDRRARSAAGRAASWRRRPGRRSGGIAGGRAGTAGGRAAQSSAGLPPRGGNPLLGPAVAPGGQDDAADQRHAHHSRPAEQRLAGLRHRQEEDTVEAMLRKIDILPLQVRIDAMIAEVTLNDKLQYGTQFFFKAAASTACSASRQPRTSNARPGAAEPEFPGLRHSAARPGRRAVRAQGAAGGDDRCKVLSSPELHGARQPAGPAAGRQPRALSQPDLAEHARRQRAGDQLDQLPADRRDHGGDAAGEQRRPGDARHLAGGQRRRHDRDDTRASPRRPSSSATSPRAWSCRTGRRSASPG